MHSEAKIRFVGGGNRSGKTEIGVADALLFLLGWHPERSKDNAPPVFIRYCAPSWEDGIKPIILKKIKELVPRSHLEGGTWEKAWFEKARTLKFKNGSECRFFSYEQDVGKMGGADLDGVYLDEHAPQKVFIESIARTTDRNGYIVLTMTPEAGVTWEQDAIIDASERDKDIEFWFFSTYKNPHLSKEGVAKMVRMITDERLRDAKLHGRFVALSGLVYPQFVKGTHVVDDFDVPDRWWRQFVIDPHHRKATAMLWRAIDPDGVSYVYREAEFEPTDGGVPELAEFIRIKSAGDSIKQWICDEAMGGKGMNIYGSSSVVEQLRNNGIPVVGTNQEGTKAFAAGISRMRSALLPDPVTGKPLHYIFESCKRTIKEFMRYRYRTETKADEELMREHVVNVNDDMVTCDRYGLMAQPTIFYKEQTGPYVVLSGQRRSRVTGVV